MPIDNNFIQINNESLRPSPKFSIAYETFKSGEYIIGGILKLTLNGEIYGASSSDLTTKISNISQYSGKCQTIYVACEEETLVDTTGFVRSVTINPTDQPFVVNYTIEIEISNLSNNKLSVSRDLAFTNLFFPNTNNAIPLDINLKNYEENLTITGDDSLSNTGFYGGGIYTKAQLKLSGQISIQANHHMCENNNDIIEHLFNILQLRFQKILALDITIGTSYPSIAAYCNNTYITIHDNKNITINKIDNKVNLQFDMYIIPKLPLNAYPKSIVELTIAENTEQATGLSNLTVRGSVKGLSNKTTDILNNKVLSSEKLSNARNAYAWIVNSIDNRDYAQFIVLGDYNGAIPPADICYNPISSQVTENLNNGEITFDLTYGDLQFCQIGGANIDVNITEDFPTPKYVEHIIPGRAYPIVQVGYGVSAMKITLTVSGKLNGCDTSKIHNLVACIDNKLTTEKNSRGYNGYILQNTTKTFGKYSYKVTESYIGFDPVDY